MYALQIGSAVRQRSLSVLLHRYTTPQRAYIDMDYNPASKIMVLVAMPPLNAKSKSEKEARPLFIAHLLRAGSLQPLGRMSTPPHITSVIKLRFLARGSNTFVTGNVLLPHTRRHKDGPLHSQGQGSCKGQRDSGEASREYPRK